MDINGIIWLSVFVICVIVEALTVQMVCIWFAAAGLLAFAATMLGAPLWLQLTLFILCAALLLYFTRPIVKSLMKRPAERTNADRALGKQAIVIEEIDNDGARGQVKLGGQIWSARSAAGSVIPAGTKVLVRSIEGVKVIVDEITELQDESKEVVQCQ